MPATGVPELADVFDSLSSAFDDAATGGVVERTVTIAGFRMRLLFAGPAMPGVVFPALAHADEANPGDPVDITVKVWDTASTGTRLQSAPMLLVAGVSPVQPLYVSSEIRVAFRGWESTVTAYHRRRREALWCVADATSVAAYDVAYPMKDLLQWWMADHELHLAHSASVGMAGRGVLLPGPSGAGKSTVAALCRRAGMAFAGDDYVLVGVEPPRVHGVFNSNRLDPNLSNLDPTLFPALATEEDKAIEFSDAAASLDLAAIVLPRVCPGRRAALRPGRRGAALLALGPPTALQLPTGGAEAIPQLAAVVRALPVYELDVGDDLDRVPGLVRGVLGPS